MTSPQRHQHTRRIFKVRSLRSRRQKRLTFWTVGAASLVAAALLFDVAIRQVYHPLLDADNVALVEAGRVVYARACSVCHGVLLQGQPNWRERSVNGKLPAPPLDASGHAWRFRDRDLFAITKGGPAAYPAGYSTDMPSFDEQLSEEEIAATLAYVKSIWPTDVRAKQARRNMAFWSRTAH